MSTEEVERLSTYEVTRYADLMYKDAEREAERDKALYKVIGPMAAFFSLGKK